MVSKFSRAAALVALTAALGAASPAFANAGEDVTSTLRLDNDANNAKVAYAYSLKSYGNKNVAVQDKWEDGHHVYSEFDRKNTKGKRLWNKSDIHNRKTYSDSSTKNYVVKVTACMHYNNLPDSCGPSDRPGDGR